MSSLLPMKACFQCHKPTILCKNFAHIRTMKIIFKFFIRFDHLGLHFTYLLYLKFSVAVSSVVKNQMKMISIVKFFFHIDLNSNPVEIFHHFSVWKTQWIFHYVQCNVMKKYTMNRQTASRRKKFFFWYSSKSVMIMIFSIFKRILISIWWVFFIFVCWIPFSIYNIYKL